MKHMEELLGWVIYLIGLLFSYQFVWPWLVDSPWLPVWADAIALAGTLALWLILSEYLSYKLVNKFRSKNELYK